MILGKLLIQRASAIVAASILDSWQDFDRKPYTELLLEIAREQDQLEMDKHEQQRRDEEKLAMKDKIEATFYGPVNGPINFGRITGNILSAVSMVSNSDGGKDFAITIEEIATAIEGSQDLSDSKKQNAWRISNISGNNQQRLHASAIQGFLKQP